MMENEEMKSKEMKEENSKSELALNTIYYYHKNEERDNTPIVFV